MNPDMLVKVGGICNPDFAVFHLFFWRLFRWKENLAFLTYTNRAVTQILNLSLTFVLLLSSFV